MNLQVSHRTSYAYGRPVSIAHHVLHLSPRVTDRQDVMRFHLEIEPRPSLTCHAADFFGNAMSVVTFEQEHSSFAVTARSDVVVRPRAPMTPEASVLIRELDQNLGQVDDGEALDIRQFLFESPYARCPDRLHEWSATTLARERPALLAAIELNRQIHRSFTYDAEATKVGTSVEECFEVRRGVCQDFTHLMLAALRSHRIPARYVSGYLRSRGPAAPDGLIGADASHAWVQAFVPPFGWVDLDPTNDLIPDQNHVTLAFGRDFADVSPVNGVIFGGGAHTVRVEVDVRAKPDSSETT